MTEHQDDSYRVVLTRADLYRIKYALNDCDAVHAGGPLSRIARPRCAAPYRGSP